MTKIDIFSGFLGAGKTTLIKKLIKEAYAGEKLVLIENEFGEIGIDGGFLQDAGVEITEMNSGCICCSLVGDFGKALEKVLSDFAPDRILIEPSGVGKLSDVIRAVMNIESDEIELDGFTAVVDAGKCKMYMKNFGEFFNDQIEHAGTIVLSRSGDVSEAKLATCLELLRQHNENAIIITTPWEQLDGKQIADAVSRKDTLSHELHELLEEHEHHHHHHDHDEHCDCGCHDHDHEHHHEYEHHHDHDHEHEHHHDHDEHCDCGCHDHDHEHHHEHDHDHEHHHEHHHDHEHHHEHHHDHDEHCNCGCHDHDHHHHHADDVFASWGVETAKKFTEDEINDCLEAFEDMHKYGMVLRAKGIVAAADGRWIHFDYVPGEANVRYGIASITGRLCVIGSGIKEDALKELFGV
ncbi:MAG: GTP-binding protein [Clostridia bacterium]|nr:GTP-binding protein [Clostridia bacterium]